VQVLGLEYLYFADGLKATEQREREEERHTKLLGMVVRAGLVSTGQYEEKVLFQEYFTPDEIPEGMGINDADLDLDVSGVDFGVPTEDELKILQQLLGDQSVTVSGMEDTPAPEEVLPALPAPRQIDPAHIEQDREWV
jgi:hypothetical protein